MLAIDNNREWGFYQYKKPLFLDETSNIVKLWYNKCDCVRLYRFEITFAVIVCRVIFVMGGLNDEKDRNDG